MLAYLKLMLLFAVVLNAETTKTENPFCTDNTGHPDNQQLTRAAQNMGPLVTRGTWKACGSWNVSIDRVTPALAPPTGFSVTGDEIRKELGLLLAKQCKYGYVTFNDQNGIPLQIDTGLAYPAAAPCN